jgi:acetyl-CoA C-acetyltransferase
MNLDISILSACRTPLGGFQGTLAQESASALGAVAVRGALIRAGVADEDVSEIVMGNVLQAGQGQAPARQVVLAAGLPTAVRSSTINRVCGSGLQAVMQGCLSLATGMSEVVVAGGMENMSQAPYLLPKARTGLRLGHHQVVDSLVHDGLWDPYSDQHMGTCAEETARGYALSREAQDAYAMESFRRANVQLESNGFADEIVPVDVTDHRGNATRIALDEGPPKARYDKMPTLKPAFGRQGTITAANASSLNDGAAALVLARVQDAMAAGRTRIGRIVSFGSHAQEPTWFTTAPAPAARQALKGAGWAVEDVDLWEVNEAFAVVPLAFMRDMGLTADRVNVRGGAIALGHPIGCSGARIIVTLLAALRAAGKRRGVAAICIGGGEGMAVCVEADV